MSEDNFKEGDRISICTPRGLGLTWIFGVITIKSKKALHITIYQIREQNRISDEGMYSSLIRPDWNLPIAKVIALMGKDGTYYYNKMKVRKYEPKRKYRYNQYYY